MDRNELWDVIVVGGGPAGMMAAGTAAHKGHKVLLLEKNETLGKKLLITGGGRCNVTNAEEDLRRLLARFKDADKFLFSPFSQFDNKSTLEFFNSRGMETKVEAENRVFPISDSAESVWNVLVDYMKTSGVEVRSRSEVKEIKSHEDKVSSVVLKNGKELHAKHFILATGGKSHPETGSTGDGFSWLRTLGHKVHEPSPYLVPISVNDEWVKQLSGTSLKDAKITALQSRNKQFSKKGKILFTHFGLSGPAVLNMSRDIYELLKYGDVELSLDTLPQEDFSTLNTRLQEIFKSEDKKKIKNALDSLVSRALAEKIILASGIDLDKPCNSVTREERITLMKKLKDMRMSVKGLLGEDKAIVTSGGVDLEEIDWRTLSSKLYPNLYITGDLLNIDRPSGGYSLQLCWTTGFVAGNSIN
jgi:predicted Rossmann fold flavoprotein